MARLQQASGLQQRQIADSPQKEWGTKDQGLVGSGTPEQVDGELMEVVCPPELGADRTIRIALPDAREFDVVVPEGVAAGDTFLVGPFPSAEG